MIESSPKRTVAPVQRAHTAGALRLALLGMLIGASLLTGCANLRATDGAVYQRGEASYYGARFQGRRTASGERFDANRLTAAHRSLPMGTRVRVTNDDNGRSVIVRVNDRGPHVRGRVIDLSRAAAVRLDMIRSGIAPVTLRRLD